MTTTTTYNIDGHELEQFMAKFGSDMVPAWFCGNRPDTESVCRILKVSRCTLTNYIKAGSLTVLNFVNAVRFVRKVLMPEIDNEKDERI